MGQTASYRSVLCQLDLLGKPHQEDFGPLGNPFVVELLLCCRALDVVGRLEALQQGGQRRVDLGGEDRHVACRDGGVVFVGSSPGACSLVHRQGPTKTGVVVG